VDRHVRLLAVLVWLWGALGTLIGVSMLLLGAGTFTLLVGRDGERVVVAAGISTVLFVVVGAFALLWGLAHMWASALLRRRVTFGRVLMLGLGLVNLLVFPFGTGLGVFVFWVLLTHEGHQLFEAPDVGSAQA
jgi:hypothetical protein